MPKLIRKKIMIKLKVVLDKPFPVNEIGPDIKNEQEYELKEEYTCNCKEVHYNIGLPLKVNYVECYKCRERLPDTTHWCHSSRFTKV